MVERLSLVDVGALGGVQDKLRPYMDQLDLTMVEPAKEHADWLSAQGYTRVLPVALWSLAGRRTLHVTRFSDCSSLLPPNPDELGRYHVSPAFDVVATREIECVRYDELVAKGDAPLPDFIKSDTQGAEYEVLLGFGPTLDHCLGVELEVHLYPIYRGQKLLGDIVELLGAKGLYLRTLEQQNSFDGDRVEFNACFMRRPHGLSHVRLGKMQLIERALALETYEPAPFAVGLVNHLMQYA